MKDLARFVSREYHIARHVVLFQKLKVEIRKFVRKHKVFPYVTSYTAGLNWAHLRLTKRKPKLPGAKLPKYKRRYDVTLSLKGQETKKNLPIKIGMRWLRSQMKGYLSVIKPKKYSIKIVKNKYVLSFELQDTSETRSYIIGSLSNLDDDGNYPVKVNGLNVSSALRLRMFGHTNEFQYISKYFFGANFFSFAVKEDIYKMLYLWTQGLLK